ALRNGGRGVRGRQHIGGLEIGHPWRRLVALLEVHEAGGGVDDVGKRGARAPRAGLPEARDGTVDDVRLHRPERLVVALQPGDDARHEILYDDVRDLRQVADDRLALGSGHIHADALFPGVHAGEVAALVAAAGFQLQVVASHLVARARTLDLDHA